MAANGVDKNGKLSHLDGQAPESTDFANYFCTYGYLYHQKDMLEDHKRTGAYYRAVMNNKKCFEGKVVLDVGTGSGILALFAAMAGAAKVYAVEATDMARKAREIIEHNGYSATIEVIQGTIETVEIPDKVDIIISEWMGYFLLRESMLDSVLCARDRFLKPEGAMYPSHARILMCPIRSSANHKRLNEYHDSIRGWDDFASDMRQTYGVDLGVMDTPYEEEQRQYFLRTSLWQDVHPQSMMGPPVVVKEYDLKEVTIEELKAPLKAQFSMPLDCDGPVEALCGYFDCKFAGSAQRPAYQTVELTTAPDATGATHWGQQVFLCHPPIKAMMGDRIDCDIEVVRRKDNQRLMEVAVAYQVNGDSDLAQGAAKRSIKWNIE
ncbi:unnamed protein product [Pedinophyceae sp. YPF-701]|nr:unnamed protein product [Pedinophyceae sp. YPF-701]